MYRIPIYKVELVRETNYTSLLRKISGPSDVALIMQPHFARADRESVWCIMLNLKNKVLGLNQVSIGGLDSSILHPREVFKPALIAGAASIVLVHNHPSGDPTPSLDDITTTQRLYDAGRLLGIGLLDHVVLGDGHYESIMSHVNK